MFTLLKAIKHAFGILYHYYIFPQICKYGHIGEKSSIGIPADLKNPANIFIGNDSRIGPRSTILTVGNGQFIYGNHTGAAEGLTVIASNHKQSIGKIRTGGNEDNIYKNVIVDDDVWLGINVTLLPGTVISRGCIIGAGAVCSGWYPPYAVVAGNPAKIIKFKFSIDNIIIHEESLYPETNRLGKADIEAIFAKYPAAAQRQPYIF